MKVVIIDNDDSYTNNIALLVTELTGVRPWITRNDVSLEALMAFAPEAIILSAGPGDPRAVGGVCRAVIDAFPATPLLGICLGHQLIALHFGGQIARVREPLHGTTVAVEHDGTGLFDGVPQGFLGMRYHSLTVQLSGLRQTASGDGEVLALAHSTRPLYGVQFHPESVASEHGRDLMANFLGLRWEATLQTALPADAPLLHEALFSGAPASFLIRHPEDFSFIGTGVETDDLTVQRAVSAGFPFGSGLVGVIPYEGEPARMLAVDRCLVIDHRAQAVSVVVSGPTRLVAEREARAWKDTLEEMPLQPRPVASGATQGAFVMDRQAYTAAIAQCFEWIRAGECYELCLTNRFEGTTALDAWTLYRRLLERNPSPYAALLRFADTALIMSSPECLLRVEDGVAQTRPIKGTRRRGKTPVEDEALRQELASSAKDRRENLMIVDVARHDLAGISDDVSVPSLLNVETHPTVFQLVSTIRARLTTDAITAVRALLPPASMTGAPKARAVDLLRSLEPTPRGFYAGAAGYLSAGGGADLAVVIRSLCLTGDHVSFGVGGAIVLGSDPQAEWDEAMLKARALLESLAVTTEDASA